MVAKALRDFRTRTLLLLYMISNGKGDLKLAVVYMGMVLFSYTAVCFKETIFVIVPSVVVFLLLFYCFCVVKSGRGLEDHIQGVLIGGGSQVLSLFHCGHAY